VTYLSVFIFYFLIIFLIAFWAIRRTSNHKDYILGGRKLNSWVVALGAGASDMSGWLLMGLPGAVFVIGMNQLWMPVGLLLGAFLNWTFVAKKIRVRSEEMKDASTIPAFIENSFSNPKYISIVTTTAIIIFFAFYVAAGFVSAAVLFQTLFGFSYHHSLMIGFLTVTIYTFIGGFIAVNWVDLFQGTLMLFALIVVPTVGLIANHHSLAFAHLPQHYFNPFHGVSAIKLVSLLGWGFGYFGQPHVLVRFMAIKDPEKLTKSRNTAITWMFLCLFGAMLCGLAGRLYYGDHGLSNPEAVFLSFSKDLFHPIIGGILFSAVLSAVMSTIAAQLLISSSAIAEDVLVRYVFKTFSVKKRLWFNRFVLLAMAFIALFIARSPNSSILKLVSYAWAGLGASFGPLIIMLCYQKKITELGAVMGIIVGAATVVIWKNLTFLGGIFSLYEIIPGFIFSFLTIILVSKLTAKCSKLTS